MIFDTGDVEANMRNSSKSVRSDLKNDFPNKVKHVNH